MASSFSEKKQRNRLPSKGADTTFGLEVQRARAITSMEVDTVLHICQTNLRLAKYDDRLRPAPESAARG